MWTFPHRERRTRRSAPLRALAHPHSHPHTPAKASQPARCAQRRGCVHHGYIRDTVTRKRIPNDHAHATLPNSWTSPDYDQLLSFECMKTRIAERVANSWVISKNPDGLGLANTQPAQIYLLSIQTTKRARSVGGLASTLFNSHSDPVCDVAQTSPPLLVLYRANPEAHSTGCTS